MSGPRPRVLALALDAADGPLALRWAREGRLPVLGRLIREGATARLLSAGDLFPESVWPTIVTGSRLGGHGIYNWRIVPPGTYSLKWAPNGGGAPFWRVLREHGDDLRALLVDVPFTAPLGDDGVTEVIGWGQRGSSLVASWPPDLMDTLRDRHGSYPFWAHVHYHRRPSGQRRLLRTLERMAAVRTTMIAELMRDRPWSVCLACYSEPHDGGHEFHRYVDPDGWGHGRRRARGAEDGLLRLYRAIDRGVGELVDAAGEPVNVLVFSGMGLRQNTSGYQVLRRVLTELGYQVPARSSAGFRPLQALRRRLPWSIRHQLHQRLSQPARERLMERLWLEATDWGRSRAYAEEEPGVGYVHVNVRGRDPEGIVEPGHDYRALCAEIGDELRALREVESGAPAVDDVLHRDELVGGDRAGAVPDLIVRWSQQHVIRAVRHPRLGVIKEDARDIPYTEHTNQGFLVAAGPGIPRGVELDGDVADLAPTLLALMDVPVPAAVDGEPLAGLVQAAAP